MGALKKMIGRKILSLLNRIGWTFFSMKLDIGKNARVGTGYEFINPQNITIGNNFKAYNNIKLQTWPVYHNKGTGYNSHLIIGDNVSCMNNVQISCLHNVVIGDGTLIGDNVFITDNYHGNPKSLLDRQKRPLERDLYLKGDVIIDENVWIGRNACIMGNVHIHKGAIIGANSVVTHDVPENVTVAGAPAKII